MKKFIEAELELITVSATDDILHDSPIVVPEGDPED